MGGGGNWAERERTAASSGKREEKEKSSILHPGLAAYELWVFWVMKGEKRWRRQKRLGAELGGRKWRHRG